MSSGGGGGGPTQSTSYTTNLPEYAEPYVMNMLGAAQNQLFTTTPGIGGEPGEITGFKPYTPYSTDPTKYFAGPSRLQQSTYNEAAGMQTPGVFNQAQGLSAAAGQGGLNAQGQANQLMNTSLGYGQAGANYGAAGSQYGAAGADQARADSMRAQQAAQMYGQQGAGYGQAAANLAPEAQRYGRTAADIGQMGLRAEQLGRDVSQQARDYAAQQAGAGTQFQRQVTDPSQIAQYMSPYQQQVTDIAKADALRNAQLAQQQANLGSARQGTYGGARQALAQAEREKNLLSNLSNIQATGSQSAYDKAMQQMQYGSGLGLQGLSGAQSGLGTALQGAQTGLSGIGTAMQGQQAGLSGLGQAGSLYGQGMQGAGVGLSGVGQMLGAGQLGLSGAQTGIQGSQAGMQGAGVGLSGVGQGINAGQYGMQGLNLANTAAGTMGNLGTAQQQADLARMNFQNQMGGQQQTYQQNIINQAIQDYATQQQYPYMQLSTMSNLLRGLPMQGMSTQQYQAQPSFGQQAAGLAGAYGAYRGAFREGGTIKSLEDKIDDIGDAGKIKGLQGLLAKTTSPGTKELIMARMREEGIAGAPTGGLGRNMAGGGIIAFSGKDGSQVEEMTDEEREEYIKNNAYLQRSAALANFPAATGEFLRKYNPVTGSAYSEAIQRFVNESPEDQATRFRKASSRKEQAANPMQEVSAVKTATQRQEDNDRADALASIGQYSKADYKKAEENLRAARPKPKPDTPPPADNVATSGVNPGEKSSMEDAYARYLKMTGQDQTPQEMTDYLNMLKQKSGKVGELSEEAGRMNKALAFLEAGQDPRGLLSGAVTGGKKYLQGEIANKDKFQKMELDYGKAMSDYKRAELERSKGNYDAAAKYEDKAQDRINNLSIAQLQANRPGEFEKMYGVFAESEVAAGRKPSFESFRKAYSGQDEDLVRLTKADAAIKMLKEDTTPGGYMQLAASKKPEDKQKAAQMLAAVYRRYNVDPTTGGVIDTQTAGAGGGNRLRFDASGKQI